MTTLRPEPRARAADLIQAGEELASLIDPRRLTPADRGLFAGYVAAIDNARDQLTGGLGVVPLLPILLWAIGGLAVIGAGAAAYGAATSVPEATRQTVLLFPETMRTLVRGLSVIALAGAALYTWQTIRK